MHLPKLLIPVLEEYEILEDITMKPEINKALADIQKEIQQLEIIKSGIVSEHRYHYETMKINKKMEQNTDLMISYGGWYATKKLMEFYELENFVLSLDEDMQKYIKVSFNNNHD